tara:strand:+ start:273 stop:611 length:339 start_codon:yes stop_codon:yes gene_type:complete
MLRKDDIFDSLEILSDKNRQLGYWFKNDQNVCSSFVETGCLFGGSGIGELVEEKRLGDYFSSELSFKLKDFYFLLKEIDAKNLEFKIDHPKMEQMRTEASELLLLLAKELKR